MSLPVGTLVMLVNASHPDNADRNGAIGEIVGPLGEYDAGWQTVMGYFVRVPGHPSRHPTGNWVAEPHQVIPITPPGRTDDVTTDAPIKEDATC